VIAPPYDVLSDADVDALEARSPHNIVHIDVPRERDGERRYEAAAATMQAWIADGVLVRDSRPSFTLYRMAFVDETGRQRQIVGVLGKQGVTVIDPVGEAFDPVTQQAVSQQEDPSVPEGTVIAAFQKGYEMGGRVVRPAMVVVSTGGPRREE